MPTTPSDPTTHPPSKRKRTDKPPKKQRPIDRVTHAGDEADPVDAAIDRRSPAKQLRLRIRRLSRQIHEALGQRQELWMKLEVALNELKIQREAAYFDLGFEHGFAAGRSAAKRLASGVRELAARLRDTAIQQGAREDALVALLDAAQSLAVEPDPPAPTTRAAPTKYPPISAIRSARASRVRDAAPALH